MRHTVLIAVVLLSGCAAQLSTQAPSHADQTRVLWFGGDVHFGTRGLHALDDLALDGPLIVNLEGPIGESQHASTAELLINPPEAARALAEAHVIAAGVENNHSFDAAKEGLERTRHALSANDIAPLGFAETPVPMLQVDLSRGLPVDLDAQLATHRPVIVLFHVLAPPLYLPDAHVRAAVDRAIAAGARAVLVHGSHALGSVERRGRAVIAWGLGNLAFDCDCTNEDEGLLIRLELAAGEVHRATVVPVRAGLHGARAHFPADATVDLELLESLGATLHHTTKQRADW